MINEFQTSYDRVPYQSNAFPQTHPDRLATLGHLFGLATTPVTRCKVLELGCAGGGNLIPMAFNLPESEYVGVDLSKGQVEQAKKSIADLGLNNIRIEHASIMDIDESWGEFDYIICHGVYSWVDDQVKDKILSISSRNLAPQGIAYVSYNTYPGWHMREMIRNMMRYHIDQFSDMSKRLEQARALIDFLAESVSPDGYYGAMLKSEFELVEKVRDWYLFHDHLAEVNAPLYFHQFMNQADKHDLQYLGEAEISTMLTSGFPTQVARTLEKISPDIIRAEQYMDFLRNRFFRQTLLCHKNQKLNRNLGAENLNGLLIASGATPESEPLDYSAGVKQSFKAPSGQILNTDFPFTKAAFHVLNEVWPRAIDQKTLFKKTRELLDDQYYREDDEEVWNTMLTDLLHCHTTKEVELHTWQADFTYEVSRKPKASKLSIYQINQDNNTINQRHEMVNLDALGTTLLKSLDGNRDHKMLLDYLMGRVLGGALVVSQDDQPITNVELLKPTLKDILNQTLRKLARAALLIN